MQYEMVVVFDSASDAKKGEKSVTDLIKKEGITLTSVDNWGKRILSYPLRKKTEGLYMVFHLNAEGKNPEMLNNKFKLDETILRALVMKKEVKKRNQKPKIQNPS